MAIVPRVRRLTLCRPDAAANAGALPYGQENVPTEAFNFEERRQPEGSLQVSSGATAAYASAPG